MIVKSSKKIRLRFSLRTLLFLFTLLGVCVGVWVDRAERIKSQWNAVQPILAKRGRVETKPSNIPNWTKRWLTEGETENIEAVFFRSYTATDEGINALEKLPHLRRLYLEKTGLKSHHIDTIAKLSKLERLSIWGNGINQADIVKLGQLRNLKIIDMHRTMGPKGWRALLAFRDNPNIKIIHSLPPAISQDIKPAEYEDFKSISRYFEQIRSGSLLGTNTQDLEKLRCWFPDIPLVNVTLTNELTPEYIDKYLELSQKKFFKLVLIDASPFIDDSEDSTVRGRRSSDVINRVWKQIGPLCDELEIFVYHGNSTEYFLTFRGTSSSGPRLDVKIPIDKDTPGLKDIFAALPSLPNVKSLVFRTPGSQMLPEMTPVFSKIANVEHLEYRGGYSFGQSIFWQAAGELEHVKKQTSLFFSPLSMKSMKEMFAESKSRFSITHFEVGAVSLHEIDEKSLKKIFPNIESFKFKRDATRVYKELIK